MCGRFSLTVNELELNEFFEIHGSDAPYISRYNCAPTQMLAVISNEKPAQLSYMRWGLVPSWAKDPAIGNKMINAKAETLAEKPSFRVPLRSKRCIVPATSFFEWKQDEGKTPYSISLKSQKIFGIAGLWDSWISPEGEIIHTFTLITTEANEFMQQIHHRMPVILTRENEKLWLNGKGTEGVELLMQYNSEDMQMTPLSKLVNSPRNEMPEILLPLPKETLF